MPNRRLSVHNPEGEQYVTENERFEYQKQQDQKKDWMLQQALRSKLQQQSRPQPQQRQAAAPAQGDGDILSRLVEGAAGKRYSMQNGGLVDHQARVNRGADMYERFKGNFDDNAGQEINMQETKNAPAMRGWDIHEKDIDRRWDAGQAERDFRGKELDRRSAIQGRMFDGDEIYGPDLDGDGYGDPIALSDQDKIYGLGGGQSAAQLIMQDILQSKAQEAQKAQRNDSVNQTILQNRNIDPSTRKAAANELGVGPGPVDDYIQQDMSPEFIEKIKGNIKASPAIAGMFQDVADIAQKGAFAGVREAFGQDSAGYSAEDFQQIREKLIQARRMVDDASIPDGDKMALLGWLKKQFSESLGYEGLFQPSGRDDAARIIDESLR